MKCLLAAVNAKFIHSSLALRCLKTYARAYQEHLFLSEFTINQEEDFILGEIYKQKPEVVCFSCYIWNINLILSLAENVKKVLPEVKIVLGGPEVSYDAVEYMEKAPFIDIIIRGEGEITFLQIVEYFLKGTPSLLKIDGITYRNGEKILQNKDRAPMDLNTLPFVYDSLEDMEHRILYYESQRGCPYQCQYCLSSLEKGVRFLNIARVEKDLQFFLDNNVRQVKFVDRTFNCNKRHAMAIWRYLMEHDNGITNFHMEITADLLDEEIICFLKKARKGLFQFEIGVQSTNDATISAIQRNTSFQKLSGIVKKLKEGGNIHLHLDLIAGLPKENYENFKHSFNDVYALKPEQFQLGFLKLLKGSGLRRDAKAYGIIYRENAPYEVLYTSDISFAETLRLKAIEEMVETYYNSGKALLSLAYFTKKFPTAFDFYEALGDFWQKEGLHKLQHSKMELYTILYQFSAQSAVLKNQLEIIRDLLLFDIYSMDNVKTLPFWAVLKETEEEKKKKRAFYQKKENIELFLPEYFAYSSSQISRMCNIVIFSYDVTDISQNLDAPPKRADTAILFDYHRKSGLLGRCVSCKIEL